MSFVVKSGKKRDFVANESLYDKRVSAERCHLSKTLLS